MLDGCLHVTLFLRRELCDLFSNLSTQCHSPPPSPFLAVQTLDKTYIEKLTILLEAANKAQKFFLLAAEDNVLLTLSDEPIVLPLALVEKKRVGNYQYYQAWADMAAAAGEYDNKVQNFEDRALKSLPSVLERTNLHKFTTQTVKHARVALAAAQVERNFKIVGGCSHFGETRMEQESEDGWLRGDPDQLHGCSRK
jgi:hypothetical protein